jgi:hypothetical protein
MRPLAVLLLRGSLVASRGLFLRCVQACDSQVMSVEIKLESLLADARAALAGLNAQERTVAQLLERVGALRYAEGQLIGFLDALALTDPYSARAAQPLIEGFIAEAIAARVLLD